MVQRVLGLYDSESFFLDTGKCSTAKIAYKFALKNKQQWQF